jgi:hypothetical protein
MKATLPAEEKLATSDRRRSAEAVAEPVQGEHFRPVAAAQDQSAAVSIRDVHAAGRGHG